MPTIPRSCSSRRALTFARLLLRVYPRRDFNAFEGMLLKPGAVIEESALWPTEEYPRTPLLLEYAGNDCSGRGHNRSNDIYILWRYCRAAGKWNEIARCVSQGAEWMHHMKAIAIAELGREGVAADPRQAATVSGRVLGMLDAELERMDTLERHLVMSFVLQEFSARAVAYS